MQIVQNEIDHIIQNQAIIMEGLATVLTVMAAPSDKKLPSKKIAAVARLLGEAAKNANEYAGKYQP